MNHYMEHGHKRESYIFVRDRFNKKKNQNL